MAEGITVVLVLAAGAGWESAALQRIEERRELALLRRCVDVEEMLATAAAGQAEVALVGADAPGLDAHAVDQLHRHGLRVVAVVPDGPAGEQARERGLRAGVAALTSAGDLAGLAEALVAPEPPRPVVVPGIAGPRAAEGEPAPERISASGASGRVLVIWGASGAPGRSTVAAALAAELARRERATLLVDADPYGGAIAQQIGILDEVSGLLAAARLAASGDLATALPGVVRMIGGHLGVVTGLPRPDRWRELRGPVLAELLSAASATGDVVVDTGFDLEESDRNQLTHTALERADEVLVVGAADPVGLTRLARGLAELRERGHTASQVVVNRMRPSLGWTQREVAQMLGRLVPGTVPVFLPDDRAGVDRALVTGRTLLEAAPDGPLAVAVAALADRVAPPRPTTRTAGRARRR